MSTHQLAELEDGYSVTRPHRRVDPAMRRAFHAHQPGDSEGDRRRALMRLLDLLPPDEVFAAVLMTVATAAELSALETAVLAHEIDGLTKAQTAAMLGKAQGTIHSASARAKTKLANLRRELERGSVTTGGIRVNEQNLTGAKAVGT